MRTICIALVTCLALAACGGDSGGGASGAGHAGTYSLDRAQFKAMAVDSIKKQAGLEELPPEQMAMLDGMLSSAAVDMVLKADGTWHVTGLMGGDALDESGTWTVAGESITFVTTKKEGKDFKDEKTGQIADGVITVKPDESMPGAIRLVRK